MQKSFYLFFSLWSLAVVILGFWPMYFSKIISGDFDIQPIIHVHAFIFLGWIALFFYQALQIYKGDIKAHKKWGKIGIYYGALVLIMGVATTLVRNQFHLAAGNTVQANDTLFVGIRDMILFGFFFSMAMIYRKKPLIHKIWILSAAACLLIAGVARINGVFLGGHSLSFYILWFLPILLALYTEFRRKNPYWWHFFPIIIIMLFSTIAKLFF